MKKICLVTVFVMITAVSYARTMDYQSQAHAEKEAQNEYRASQRAKWQEDNASAAQELEAEYERDANRSKMASDRVQDIVNQEMEENSRAATMLDDPHDPNE